MSDRVYNTDPIADIYVERALDEGLAGIHAFLVRSINALAESDPELHGQVDVAIGRNTEAALDVCCTGSGNALEQMLSFIMLAICSAAEAMKMLDEKEAAFQADQIMRGKL